jgi:chitin synthase
LVNPYWMEDPDLKKSEVEFLGSEEKQFWKDLIDKYLYPLDKNAEEQVQNKKQIKINAAIAREFQLNTFLNV